MFKEPAEVYCGRLCTVNKPLLTNMLPNIFIRFLRTIFSTGKAQRAKIENYAIPDVLGQKFKNQSTDDTLISARLRDFVANFIEFVCHKFYLI